MAGYRTVLAVPMVREGSRDRRDHRRAGAGCRDPSPTADRACSRPSPTRRSSPSRTCGCSRNCEARNRELTEALEQQTATGEILRVIASSPTDLQPVMEAVAENAARVCGATDSSIFRLEGEHLRLRGRHGSLRRSLAIGDTDARSARDIRGGRAVCDRRTIHVEDIMAAEAEFPAALRSRQVGSVRTVLATPLLREGAPIGASSRSRGTRCSRSRRSRSRCSRPSPTRRSSRSRTCACSTRRKRRWSSRRPRARSCG